jgi:hypothetical protein
MLCFAILTGCRGSAARDAGLDLLRMGVDPKRFTAESGIVETTSDVMGTMVVTTYFRKHGSETAIYIDIDTPFKVSVPVVIQRDDKVITYDPVARTGTMRKQGEPEQLAGFGVQVETPSISEVLTMSEKDLDRYTVTSIASRTILGREGKGFAMVKNMMTVRGWIWENIVLREELTDDRGKTWTTEVTRLELGVPVPDEKFEVPADVIIVE